MNKDDEKGKPYLRLRKKHQLLANELGMTAMEYINYRREIDKTEELRILNETVLTPLDFTSFTYLIDNIDNLGYEKAFLNIEDAEFLCKKVLQWEEDNCYVEASDDEEHLDINLIQQTYLATGVKYNFKNIGIIVYSIFEFSQSNYTNSSPDLEYEHQLFLYNERSKVFQNIKGDDLLSFNYINE